MNGDMRWQPGFYEEQISLHKDTASQLAALTVRFNHQAYVIGPDPWPGMSRNRRGFSGERFDIVFTDGPHKGREVESHNLTHLGHSDEADNAEFRVFRGTIARGEDWRGYE